MPYSLRKVGDKFEVVHKDTGSPVGGGAKTKEEAMKQLAALHFNVSLHEMGKRK